MKEKKKKQDRSSANRSQPDFASMEVTYTVDASIIGGLVIRIDDRVVDSSIKTKIETMSKALAQS